MRALAGPVAVHTALALAGLGVLRALGVIPRLRSRQTFAALGLAYLVGISATLSICVIVLVLGGPFTLPVFGLLAAGLAAPLALDLRGRRVERSTISHSSGLGGAAGWAAGATLLALAVVAVIGLMVLGNRPIGVHDTDAWHLWTRRALLLFESPHLPSAIFSFSGDVRYEPHYNINGSYPLLLPLLEVLHMRALGRPDPSSVHLVLWLLAIAFAWAGGFIASRLTKPVVWAPVIAGITLLSLNRLLSGYADTPLAYYLGLGALATGAWLESGRRRDLAVAVLLLVGAAGMKNEGLAGALLAASLGLAVRMITRRRGAVEFAIAALPLVVAILPWRLWVAAHHLQTEEPIGRIANPTFLAGHTGRLGPALDALGSQLHGSGGATRLVPIALAIALTCAFGRRRRAVAGFYLALGVGYFIALVWSFWISTLPVGFLVLHAAPRVVIPLAFIGVAAILQLASIPGSVEAHPTPACGNTGFSASAEAAGGSPSSV